MQIDFSQVDTSIIDGMAIKLAIFGFGTLFITVIIAGLLTRLKVPAFIVKPITGFIMIGCFYISVKYVF